MINYKDVVEEVANKEIGEMKVVEVIEVTVVMTGTEVIEVVVVAIQIILLEKQLIEMKNTLQKIH